LPIRRSAFRFTERELILESCRRRHEETLIS
jgi:hypothetical protein